MYVFCRSYSYSGESFMMSRKINIGGLCVLLDIMNNLNENLF